MLIIKGMDLNNKIALITGGTQGIGAAIALRLSQEGANVCLVARDVSDTTIKERIESSGGICLLLSADLCQEDSCKAVVQQTIDHFGAVDILVHCAGSAAPGGMENGARSVWYQAFDIHVHAVFHLSSAVYPYMQERKQGSILLISSAAGLRGVKNAMAYSVAKGALPQFARSLALELSHMNIRVNCISPGVIRTRFQDYLTPEQVKNNVDNRIPLQREGTPEDVAEVACMLIRNDFITGENIVIDGGMTMRIV